MFDAGAVCGVGVGPGITGVVVGSAPGVAGTGVGAGGGVKLI